MADSEKKRAYDRAWKAKNPEKCKAYNRAWKAKNPEKRRAHNRAWNAINSEKHIAYSQAWNARHRERINSQRVRRTSRYPHLRLRQNFSSLIYIRLKNHSRGSYRRAGSKFKHLPYTTYDLIRRLESLFLPDMSWDNYGKWHVDHIIPDAAFVYTSVDDPEFQRCWALDNLQPLWASDNYKKSSKVPNL